ncbi:hypothetical protein BHE74_00048213, partial [Ensete ventricosum]
MTREKATRERGVYKHVCRGFPSLASGFQGAGKRVCYISDTKITTNPKIKAVASERETIRERRSERERERAREVDDSKRSTWTICFSPSNVKNTGILDTSSAEEDEGGRGGRSSWSQHSSPYLDHSLLGNLFRGVYLLPAGQPAFRLGPQAGAAWVPYDPPTRNHLGSLHLEEDLVK